MLPKVLDILWVHKILRLGILVVVFLKVVDVILVLVVAVMARAETEVWKFEALRSADCILGEGDGTTRVSIEEFNYLADGDIFAILWDVRGGGVFEAVCFKDVFGRPFVAAVVVVEVEESAGIEGGYVVFLYK